MKNVIIFGVTLFAATAVIPVANASTSDRKQIEHLLGKYEQALNRSNTDAVVPLYTKDGVFMPTEAPTAEGGEQLRAAYTHVFNTIKLDIKFNIEEIVVSGNHAFAKTLSRGKVTVLQPNITQPEENRELFVLRKNDGAWRIARYMFNKSAPSPK